MNMFLLSSDHITAVGVESELTAQANGFLPSEYDSVPNIEQAAKQVNPDVAIAIGVAAVAFA